MSLARNSKQYLGVRAILPPTLQKATRAPTSSDKAYVKGTLWLDTSAKTAYMWPGTGEWIPMGNALSSGFILATGSSTLVAGTVTVANTSIAATDKIMITRDALNASPALGHLVYTIDPGVSFSVTSYSAVGAAATTDVSGFGYSIIRPA